MMQTCESIMRLFEQEVAENKPISAVKWIEGALRVNSLASDLDNQIAHLEAELNNIEAEYIKTDMPANKAKVLARSQVDYKRYLELKALIKRVENFLSTARRRANINEV